MGTTVTAPQESLPQKLFGLTVKHAAVIFAIIYGTGFLVLSIHHSRFGLETIESFKPKVFSAGLLFAVLAGVPCIAMARTLALFGLRMPSVVVVEGEGAKYVWLIWVLDFWWVAVGLRMGSSILFTPFELFPRYPGWLFYIVYCAVVAATSVWFTDLNRWPLRTNVIDLVFFASAVVIIFRYNSRDFFLQVIWFYVVGLVFLWLRFLKHKAKTQTYDWERQGFALLGLVTIFAVLVYGHIYSAYGGGAPIRIDVTFTRPTSFSVNKTESGFLVDEDSHGYYVVHQETDAETHFIPRDAVGEIVFHGNREVIGPSK
ncbi:MAG: hypothetical protein WAQ52_12860 [Terriglobales bacterium]